MRNDKTIKKIFEQRKHDTNMTQNPTNCAIAFDSFEEPSRLILLVAWDSDWHSFTFYITFLFHLIQYTILWIRISSTTWDTRGLSRSYAL